MKHNYSRKFLLSATVLVGSFLSSYGQIPLQNAPVQNINKASTHEIFNHSTDNFHVCPSGRLTDEYIYANGLQDLAQMAYLEKQNTSTVQPTDRVVRTIPVVFHVIWNTNAENVSQTVINNLLLRLNQDFRKNNSLIANIRPAFTSVAADVEIEFCLATKDPNGATMATPGINRRQTTVGWFDSDATNNGLNYTYTSGGQTVGGPATMKGATYGVAAWDRSKYLNIWICDITNGALSGTAGYAYVPIGTTTGGLPQASLDGVVLDYNIGVQNGNSRAISHEVGHYLGLDHTFGTPTGACNTSAASDDGFSDTPRIRNAFQNVYSSCNSATTAQSCVTGTLWQYENLMDYSNCFCMFSTQQSNHMNAVLSGSRNSLNTSYTTNCAQPSPQAPVASFTGCNSAVAQNGTVTFTSTSTGNPTSYSWSITPATGWAFAGGTSATSQNPQVQFTALGTYSVALTATNAQGSNTSTSSSCITVVAAGACNNLSSPLVMGFESTDDLTGWTVENTNGDVDGTEAVTWGIYQNQTGLTAQGGTRMIGYRYNEDLTTAANDWFFTPCLALQAGVTYNLSFWHKVMASSGVTYAEKLRVRIGSSSVSTSMTQTIVDLGTLTNTSWVQSTNTFTVPTSGNYNIGFQCYSDADKFLLTVDNINISAQQSTAAPVANFTGCGNYSAGTTVTFTNTSTNSPTSNSWTITPATGWAFTGGTSATSANPQVTFNTAGSYTVSLTATNAGGSNTKTTNACVVVSSTSPNAPVADFTGCGNYTTGNTVTLTNTSTNNPTSNAWSITPASGWAFVNGTTANSVSPQVTFNTAGTYQVLLTATNGAGSNTKTTASCVVVTSNGGSASLEDLNFASGVSLYPNPTNGLTTININNVAQYTNIRLNVYNAVGQLVMTEKQVTDQMTLDLSTFSKGIYFIEIRSNEAVTTKRLVLNR